MKPDKVTWLTLILILLLLTACGGTQPAATQPPQGPPTETVSPTELLKGNPTEVLLGATAVPTPIPVTPTPTPKP
ncbi:MAG: hypothetical protein D6784_01540, partial [Chloroflexi bacterium]